MKLNNTSTIQSPFEDNIFILPNGSILPYSLPGDSGNQRFFRTKKTKRFRSSLQSTKKEDLPLLHCWKSDSNLVLINADFDEEPDAYGFADFDRLEEFLLSTIGHLGIVTRSASNKVKVFFLLNLPQDIEITKDIALDTLSKILPDDLSEHIDHRLSALSKSYITERMCIDINTSLFTLIPIEPVLDSVEENPVKGEYSSCIPYYQATPTLEAQNFGNLISQRLSEEVNRTKTLEQIMLFLMAAPSLVTTGFQISQKKLGVTAGVSQKTISLYLSKLLNAGLLYTVNKTYVPDKQAKTYRFAGLFRVLFKMFFDRPSSFIRKPRRSRSELPSRINDGEWNDTMVKNVYRFRANPDAFLEWIKSIPDYHLKDRWQQANRILKWFLRKEELLQSVQ